MKELVYINFLGGIISPGYLKQVLEIADAVKVSSVRFGLRQQLIFEVPASQFGAFKKACDKAGIIYYRKKDVRPNIISSYPAVDIFTADSWLREGVYKDVFNQFDYVPRVKINIVDSNQTFVPFFSGHINWVSSTSAHFWHLYVRGPKDDVVHCLPELVYTNDIAAVSKKVEELIASRINLSGASLLKELRCSLEFAGMPAAKELASPKFSLPYYEGFNRYGNHYWLGIYRRDESFSVRLLLDLCSICLTTRIGQVYATPWKSIIIKGISATERHLWDYALGRYRINVRHAANELNWQVEDNSPDGLQLKRYLIRHFDKEDVRTYGLSFAIKTRQFSSIAAAVYIRKQVVKNPGRLRALERYEILHTADFNPNTSELVSFRKDVEKEHLGTYLVSLCKVFYERESEKADQPGSAAASSMHETDVIDEGLVYQCRHCLTVYDEAAGEPGLGIVANTRFDDLPETYQCPLCEAGKEEFAAVKKGKLELI